MTRKVEAVQIISINEFNELTLNEEALSTILMQDDIKNKPVCVISIAGTYRGGKSFLLNFFLRYLKVKYRDKINNEWLNVDDGITDGFSFKNGSKRHTQGILMWPEVFSGNLPTGEDIAIILLDTQGTFDNKSKIADNALIFALSTLVSSIQIYNLKETIKDYDLEHLQYFSGYGELIKNNDSSNPFQNLMFLIRDWSCPYEYAFGSSGGQKYIDEFLKINEDEPKEQQQRKKNVAELFEVTRCFLLPHPGLTVATSEDFRGELKSIDATFLKHVKHLVKNVVRPENIKPKKINGEVVTGETLYQYIIHYWDNFKNGDLPELRSLYEISVEIQHLSAIKAAEEFYRKTMEELVGNKIWEDAQLSVKHNNAKCKAIESFENTKKMGKLEVYDKFKNQLSEKLEDIFETHYKRINTLKMSNEGFFSYFLRTLFKKKLVVGLTSMFGSAFGAVKSVLLTTARSSIFLEVTKDAVIGLGVSGLLAVIGVFVVVIIKKHMQKVKNE